MMDMIVNIQNPQGSEEEIPALFELVIDQYKDAF